MFKETMKKTLYIQPALRMTYLQPERIIAGSNEIYGTSGTFNKETMEEGSGDDAAVKVHSYSVWDEDWSR